MTLGIFIFTTIIFSLIQGNRWKEEKEGDAGSQNQSNVDYMPTRTWLHTDTNTFCEYLERDAGNCVSQPKSLPQYCNGPRKSHRHHHREHTHAQSDKQFDAHAQNQVCDCRHQIHRYRDCQEKCVKSRNQKWRRSSNRMAKRLRAGFQSRIGIVHFFEIFRIAKQTSLKAASSEGKIC